MILAACGSDGARSRALGSTLPPWQTLSVKAAVLYAPAIRNVTEALAEGETEKLFERVQLQAFLGIEPSHWSIRCSNKRQSCQVYRLPCLRSTIHLSLNNDYHLPLGFLGPPRAQHRKTCQPASTAPDLWNDKTASLQLQCANLSCRVHCQLNTFPQCGMQLRLARLNRETRRPWASADMKTCFLQANSEC